MNINLNKALRARKTLNKAAERLQSLKLYEDKGGVVPALDKAQAEYDTAQKNLDAEMCPIVEAVHEVQMRSYSRQVFPLEILKACEDIETSLNISKKALTGTVVHVNPWPEKPYYVRPYRHYKKPVSTQFTLERKTNGWYLIFIDRCICTQRKYDIRLSETAKMAIISRIESGQF